ncbi:NADPH-dependent 1-acyl dihydroxyacetone phosphate reductase [Coemansia nantahalensis]|uniref:NADPH-dependent 1-acyl dihydroxyacetone phosphate reductase n=1 Tax=Coemansia nantahalensis TaxID=2789366 RepID=A0ACC1K899_9FUNG|nr:NADPH-dependent 1-acyl dihydroxyacetone phosphate reductase [Coemansia nantahalensis]
MTRADANARVVLVTGCSAGDTGHHLAVELARHGCRVYASARDLSKMQGLAEHGIQTVELDVADDESVRRAVAHVEREAGRIDIVVNNAGVFSVGPAVETGADRMRASLEVNVVGVARVCSAVAPGMIARRSGLIVNIGSVSGYAATPWVGCYAASKAAVHALSDAMRTELAPFNVRVVVVAPGGIKSNLATNAPQLDLPAGSPYQPAAAAIRARAELSQTGNSTPTDQFARVVVPRILAPKPAAYISYGNHATPIWLLSFAPTSLRDWLFGRRFGTHKLAADIAADKCPLSRASSGCPITRPLLWIGVGCVAAVVYAHRHLPSLAELRYCCS